jgi:class 3 adenylate cyclase
LTCPSCSRELPGEFPYCPFCGAAVAAQPAARREERKLVTVLFADLVGFTARAERLDPEDVRSLLAPYHAHLRSELERFGGTVEKFIGDAVMALFGAPVAREDDPERAVRAALAIRDWARGQGTELQVRIAVNTGEALVSLDARPGEGESMAAGDVVNTAARLQGAAPLNGVLVGEQTYRATVDAIDYRDASAVVAKGKADPVRAWEAVDARARLGVDVVTRPSAPLVGRGRELELLASTLARVREESSPQLVTLVGVPGIGKSRLVAELFAIVERDPELIGWRQGRSLPYGEGVTFWALAEIVKAEAGILETDSPEQAREKLTRAVSRLELAANDADWLERHLGPLAGLADAPLGAQGEAFAAWRRFLEALAAERPLVLVVEDLHWADDALLDFVDNLVDRAGAVPLLVVGTARPELLERRPGWGGGKPNALTISLPPLSDEETAQLVASLVDGPLPDADAFLARVGGNPLYAEQYRRVLLERGDVQELPETVHGIIAARLDAVSEREKRLLQAAAVVGKVFWLGSVEAIDGVSRWEAEELLYGLERKEFVQRARATSVASETEYSFRHVLIRDVAYGQIPRGERSHMHRRAAAWIESLGRPDEQGELLAHHYLQALELAQAAGLDQGELADAARRALRDAGDRAAALYARRAAEGFYDAALALTSEGDPERAELLYRRATPLGRHIGGGDIGYLEQARDALLAAGDRARAAEAETQLAQTHWIAGRAETAEKHAARAQELIEGEQPSESRAWVLVRLGTRASVRGENAQAARLAAEARSVSEQVGWPDGLGEALTLLGLQRIYLGDAGGLADVERAVELTASSPALGLLSRTLNALAVAQQVLGDTDAAYDARRRAAEVSDRLQVDTLTHWFEAVLSDHHYRRGEWEDARRLVGSFFSSLGPDGSHVIAYQARTVRSLLRLAADDAAGAAEDADAALEVARAVAEVQAFCSVLPAAAYVHSLGPEPERAFAPAHELLEWLRRGREMQFGVINLPLFASAALRLGLGDDLVEALRRQPASGWTDAVAVYLGGDFAGAAAMFAATGSKPDEAEARRRAAEQLAAEGRFAELGEQLQPALAFYRSVGATRYVRECEALLVRRDA